MKNFFAKKRNIAITAAALVVIALLFVRLIGGGGAKAGVIAEGVSIAGVDVGKMTTEQAQKVLDGYKDSVRDNVLVFRCEGVEFNLDAKQINLNIDSESSVKKAYSIGRDNDKGKNKKDTKLAKNEGINLEPEIGFDSEKLLLAAGEHLGSLIKDPSPMNVETGTDCVIVTNAVPGIVVDIKKAEKSIMKELMDFKTDGVIDLVLMESKPENLTFDDFVKKYVREAKDAVYTKDGDKHNIEPEVVGISFDMEEARKIFEDNKDNTESYKIPAKITYPEVTASYLEDKYVNKIISKYSTSFAGSSSGRCANIALAAAKIDGYVLNPGQRFSYNGVVGPRTEAAGFKSAHVYVGTKVVDGIGGGICQVSSTLYNAVVLADLKTVTRVNHSIPVSYVPLGRDATVSYGTIDYVFENNKSYPVSIKAKIDGTTLTVSIVGTSGMDYSVEFVSEFVSSVPYGTTTTEDSSLPEGEQKVITRGSNGSVYQSYRVYKKDGKVYDKKPESKSRYQPVAAEVVVGTGVSDKTDIYPDETNGDIPRDENISLPENVTPPTEGSITPDTNLTQAAPETTNPPVNVPNGDAVSQDDISSQPDAATIPSDTGNTYETIQPEGEQ